MVSTYSQYFTFLLSARPLRCKKLITLICFCFMIRSLNRVSILQDFYWEYGVSVYGTTAANRRTYAFLPNNHDLFMCVLWICANMHERKRRIEMARSILVCTKLYWQVRQGYDVSEWFYQLYTTMQAQQEHYPQTNHDQAYLWHYI